MSPPDGVHAAHLFYVLLPRWRDQADLIAALGRQRIAATFHYVPLDSSPAGQRYGRVLRPLTRTADFSRRIVRLPLWVGMTTGQVDRVIDAVRAWRPEEAHE